MSVLGAGSDGPQPGEVWRMHPDLYDPTDGDHGHPLLVLYRDEAVKAAEVATRTTKPNAAGRKSVAHQPSEELNLNEIGWWRLDYGKTHWVPFAHFDDPSAVREGDLDEKTWVRLLDVLWPEEKT